MDLPRWLGFALVASLVPAARSNSIHLARLCRGHRCESFESPLLDYDPKTEQCLCRPHPCWDDNGLAHACDNREHPFLTFHYEEDGTLQCKCSSMQQINSLFISNHTCGGHRCENAEFPVLDLVDDECMCRKHFCWDVDGVKHSCDDNAAHPLLHYRQEADGTDVCECKAMLRHPELGGGFDLAGERQEEQNRREAANMEHGFPMPPDTRPTGCKEVKEDLTQHTVSIVIPWLKEKWSHMQATLRALLYFTPDQLIKEFIFISDGNEDSREADLKAISDKVKVLALPERVGLMIAKTKGVQMATAPVIVFMEAHCIVNQGWLEPLLQRLIDEPRTLAMPALDIIPEENFYKYYKNAAGYWRYEWNFNLIYKNPGGTILDNLSDPYLSPGTSGGIFAIRRDWFNHLGFFDEGMQQWGGDHMELTMKVWRCGGRIEIVPCSRIGHLFRTAARRPYDVEVAQVIKNYARLARSWAGDYLETFFKVKPEARPMVIEDLDQLQKEHDELGCEDMGWYLEHVDVEMAWEVDRACIPGGDRRQGGCAGSAVGMHSTIDQEMPKAEYLNASAVAAEKLKTRRQHSAEKGKAWTYVLKEEL